MSSFSSKILQPPCSADFSAVGGRCREGGPVFVFAPATSCLPCTWQSGAPPVLHAWQRSVCCSDLGTHRWGFARSSGYLVCGDGFFLVPGCVTKNSLPSLCCHTELSLCSSFGLGASAVFPSFLPCSVIIPLIKSLNRISSAGGESSL